MGWSSGKVYGSVQRLEKEGLVHTEKDLRGGRSILKVQTANWSEFFAKEELEEFETLSFEGALDLQVPEPAVQPTDECSRRCTEP
jgi:DNA-binding PadR family transcriptional regulator